MENVIKVPWMALPL